MLYAATLEYFLTRIRPYSTTLPWTWISECLPILLLDIGICFKLFVKTYVGLAVYRSKGIQYMKFNLGNWIIKGHSGSSKANYSNTKHLLKHRKSENVGVVVLPYYIDHRNFGTVGSSKQPIVTPVLFLTKQLSVLRIQCDTIC